MDRLFEMDGAVGIKNLIVRFKHGGSARDGLAFNIDAAHRLYYGKDSITFEVDYTPPENGVRNSVDISAHEYNKYIECKARPANCIIERREHYCRYITDANKVYGNLDPNLAIDLSYNREVWIDLRMATFAESCPLSELDNNVNAWWTKEQAFGRTSHTHIDRVVIWVSDTDIRIYEDGIRQLEASLLSN